MLRQSQGAAEVDVSLLASRSFNGFSSAGIWRAARRLDSKGASLGMLSCSPLALRILLLALTTA